MVLTPQQTLDLRGSHPNELLRITVKGVPSKSFYLEKGEGQKPIGIVFYLRNLECGIESYEPLIDILESSRRIDADIHNLSLFNIKSNLEVLEEENRSLEFEGNYDTGSNIFYIDYAKTLLCQKIPLKRVIDAWTEKQISYILQRINP